MIEVAYISQEVCNTEGSLGGIVYKRNMTINVGCGCILGKSRNRYIQIESLESTSDHHEVRIINVFLKAKCSNSFFPTLRIRMMILWRRRWIPLRTSSTEEICKKITQPTSSSRRTTKSFIVLRYHHAETEY